MAASSETLSLNTVPVLVSTIPFEWSNLSAEGAHGTPIKQLTLPQCVQMAIHRATSVLKARNAVDTSGTQLAQAYFEFLPDLNADANYAYATGRNYETLATPTFINTTNHGGGYEVTSSLNIFNGLSDLSSLRSSLQRRRYAHLSLKRAQQQIILDVTQAYLQVLLDRQIVQFAQANLNASRSRQKLLDAQTQVGIRSLADLYRQQAQTSADELTFINSLNRARTDLIFLVRRIRVDLLDRYDVSDAALDERPAINPYADERALVATALQERADLEARQSLARATGWDVVTARSGYFPRIDAFGRMEGTGSVLDKQVVNGVNVVPPEQRSLAHQWGSEILYSAGVTLTWGLFNRYLTRLSVARAQEAEKDAGLDAEDEHLLVEGEVEQAASDYSAVLDQLKSADAGLRAARESFAAVEARYQVGASSIVDLLTAQSALLQAETAQAQARIGLTLQNRTMQFALGTLPVQ